MNIEEYLRGLIDRMSFDNYGVEYEDNGHTITMKISLPEDESGILIGRHGETLACIRRLIRHVFVNELDGKRVVLNINDYHDQSEERIRSLVERGIDRISRTGQPFRLYRLNAGERFFVHNLVANEQIFQSYRTYSINDSDGQRVLVIDEKPELQAQEK